MIYISKFIEKYYWSKNVKPDNTINKKNGKIIHCSVKVNKTTLLSGLYKVILYKLINNTLSETILDKDCKSIIKVLKNEENRLFPRFSKTPYTKWRTGDFVIDYVMIKIITAINEKKIDTLDKNSQKIAKEIIAISKYK